MTLRLALTYALRELRAGLAGFRIFVLSLALGVAAIAGVGTLGSAIISAIGSEGRTILGGDLSASVVQRPFTDVEQAALAAQGRTSQVALIASMLRLTDGSDQALVAVKAIDAAYPLVGQLTLEGGGASVDAFAPNAAGQAGLVVEPTLMERLKLKVGDVVDLGRARFRIGGVLASEPDKAGGGLSLGPRVLLRLSDLKATGLVEPGALVTWRTRVLMPDMPDEALLKARIKTLNDAHPSSGWELRSRFDAAPGLKQNINRFIEFLTLIGFAALVVGGVGVANAVGAHLESRRASIAALKCLGASGGFVFKVYFAEVMMIALLGVALGLAAGAALPYFAGSMVARFVAVPINLTPAPEALLTATAFGLIVAALFSFLPLGRAHDVPATAIFRSAVEPLRRLPRRRYLAALGGGLVLLVALMLLASADRGLALRFLLGFGGIFLLLMLLAVGLRATARRLPRKGPRAWRMAVASLHRPGAATGSIVLSLGLGLTLLVALAEVDWNLRQQLDRQLPKIAPNFFFIDVPNAELPSFLTTLASSAPGGKMVSVPMMRGRILSVKGVPADEVKAAPEAAWVLNGDRGITYSPTIPENSALIEGTWWAADYAGPPLVSLEQEVATGLGLKLGDSLVVNVLGRDVTATVANLRKVTWSSLGINFVMVFSPATFKGAPHGHLATLALKDGGTIPDEVRVLGEVSRAYPTITSLRVKDALDAAGSMVRALTDGARLAAGFAIVASILVLASALATGQARRVREAVILKTLGATRAQLIRTFAIEYGLVGLVVAGFGLAAGSGIAAYVVAVVMRLDFSAAPLTSLVILVGALAATIGIGLAGTLAALSRSAAGALRNL